MKGASKEAWCEINTHLKTSASSIDELVKQLGKGLYGHTPRVGDAFCGGGSIPFEAARIGCEAYGSDLNPVAVLLTWASLNIVGGSEETQSKVKESQEKAFAEVDRQITEWGIEHNEKGWRADAFLYCVEAKCPATGYWIPLAPSWVVAEKNNIVAVLIPDHDNKRYNIEIIENADKDTYAKAKEGTVKNSRLICPETGEDFAISEIRGDRRVNGEAIYGLRFWENHDLIPRTDDEFQERLYCIRWIETYTDEQGREKTRRHYESVVEADLERERKVLSLLQQQFEEWQEKGFIPSRKIERGGDKTEEPIRTRGWTHWHHLFNPRQLLLNSLFTQKAIEQIDLQKKAGLCLFLGRLLNYNSRLCRWKPRDSAGAGGVIDTFSNQAFNTLFNYAARGCGLVESLFVFLKEGTDCSSGEVVCTDARSTEFVADLWITDPPYADAINYHELSEFFIAWQSPLYADILKGCQKGSRATLAIKGVGHSFKDACTEIYSTLNKKTTDHGSHLIMFTHQDPSVWADLGMILWAAGFRVSAAWTISTETDSALKKGNYVQGTVLLVLVFV